MVLVGRSADLGDIGGLAVIEASEVIDMDEDPARRRASQEGLLARSLRRSGSRRQGVGNGLGR